MMWCSTRQNKYFQRCNDRNDRNCKDFGYFIAWIEITMNFKRPKVLQTHSQSLDSSNSNHSKYYYPTHCFLLSYSLLWDMYHELWVPTLKRRKKHILALVGDNSIYRLAMGRWLGMGGSTFGQAIVFILDN